MQAGEEMSEGRIYLGLGSNIGDRVAHLTCGLEALRQRGIDVLAVSSLYLSEPDLSVDERQPGADRDVGRRPSPPARSRAGRQATDDGSSGPDPGLDRAEQPRHPWYVNCVAAVASELSAAGVLGACLGSETDCGRRRGGGHWPEPRRLDIDLLLYGDTVVDSPDLRLPHPRLHRRRFVLRPLSELAPDAWHPRMRATAAELLDGLSGGPAVWLLAPPPTIARS